MVACRNFPTANTTIAIDKTSKKLSTLTTVGANMKYTQSAQLLKYKNNMEAYKLRSS